MAGAPEQIDRWQTSRKCKKDHKRLARRARRRLEKKLGNEAPKRMQYAGYTS